jgi:hypothetical protein
LNALDTELSKHAAVTAHFGTYKLSLHSGSDKFSVYPLVAKHWGERIHVKTAGTSYLEALRVLAKHEPDLFTKIYALGRERYETDKKTYHVSGESVPNGWPAFVAGRFPCRQYCMSHSVLRLQFGVD